MGLINHNYIQIIELDKLDVHPPLYYLALKSFLKVTTFWTNYLPIKIIFGRLFTLLSSMISVCFLYKIIKTLKIKSNLIVSWVTFILLPTVLGFSFSYQQITNLRMYALAGMFISMEFYYLLKFELNSNNINLIFSLITALLAAYTHYYSAIFAGLLLLLYLCNYILRHNVYKAIRIIILGILFLIFYLPWIKSLMKQMSMPKTYWISYFVMTEQIILCIFCISIFIYPIIKYYNLTNNKLVIEQVLLILNVLILTLIFSIIYGIFNHPIFIIRYMYPALLIYEFIGISVILHLIINYSFSKYHLYYYIFIIIFLLLNSSISIVYQIPHYIFPSFKAVKNYNYWNENKRKKIFITDNEIFNSGNASDFNFSDLLYSKNKSRFYVPNNFINNKFIINNVALKKVFYDDTKYIHINH